MVVGLGNPGRKYNQTRHNVGFDIIAELAGRHDVGRPKAKFNGEVAETIIRNQKTILICPLTYMNLSGRCVRAAVDFYQLELGDLLVICDDFNLALGRIRLKPGGSAGGQNGLDDIIRHLGTRDFGRLRLGVGRPPEHWDVSAYVTGKFDQTDRELIEKAIARCADATEEWIENGMQIAMNKFNADPEKSGQTAKSKAEQKKTQENGGQKSPEGNPFSDTEHEAAD